MLSEDFDQTTDFAYEVWNYDVDGDPLMGVFDDQGKAGEFAMEQTIETGGGIMSYYPPIDRYTDLPPEERAQALATETLARLERVQRELKADLSREEWDDLTPIPIEALRLVVGGPSEHDIELGYDRDEFHAIIDYAAWTDEALEVARAYRTLARVRHLSIFEEALLLDVELTLRDLFHELNELALEKEDD